MVRFSRVWRAVRCMGHLQVRWLVQLMTQDGLMPSQFQGDGEDVGALPLNRVECEIFRVLLVVPFLTGTTAPRSASCCLPEFLRPQKARNLLNSGRLM